MIPSSFSRSTGIATVVLLAATACPDDPSPTAIGTPVGEEAIEVDTAQVASTRSIYVDRAHPVPAELFELLSAPVELESGRYRYRPRTADPLPTVGRDDFIVAELDDDEVVVRRVLEANEVDGELVIETGPAYWHEIIQGGRVDVTIPIGAPLPRPSYDGSGPQLAPIPLNLPNFPLPPLEHQFEETDVCAWVHELLALLPGSHERTVCGKEVDVDVGTGVTVAIAGTLDSLRILDQSRIRLTGNMSISMTVDPGGISGGRRPVFAPCDRAHYAGCLSTPTGAALIEFLRRFAPAIPEASIPPNRVCLPGTPVRVRSGYWQGFLWRPPQFEQCRVTHPGVLPTIHLPSIDAVDSRIRPRVTGNMTFRVKGDGQITLKIAVPALAASAAYQVTNDFKAKASIGVFVLLRTTLRNGGGTVRFDFDDTGEVTQSWDPESGWDRNFEMLDKNRSAQLLHLDNPDSIVVRVGIPIEAKAEVCIALYGCVEKEDTTDAGHATGLADRLFDEVNLGAKVGAGISMYYEATWTREQIDPDDPLIDNWNISVDGAYDLSAGAGLTIPFTGWIAPNVPREGSGTWECCRVPVADYWGQGRLVVTAATTGTDLDPDGYTVVVERADTLPSFVDEGTQIVGAVWGGLETSLRTGSIGPADTLVFGAPGVTPCNAIYSDALILSSPAAGLAVAGARATGFDIPSYAVTTPCPFLIARYRVSLTGVSANCAVVGGAVRDSVWLEQRNRSLERGDTTRLHFDVTCGTPGGQGSIEVTTDAAGAALGLSPSLWIDGATYGYFPDIDTLTVTGLAPGNHEVQLGGLHPFCASDPVVVEVTAGSTASVTPTVICAVPDAPTGGVRIQSSNEGPGDDPNGFQIVRDGLVVELLPSSGAATVTGVAAETPTVLVVTDIVGNCQPLAPNPRVVELDAARTPVDLSFPVRCIEEKVDTIAGYIDASGWPATTVTVRTPDGVTRTVNGPKTDELARLTGSAVRAWGEVSATGFNVFGYDLRSTLGDDRWLGILLDGPDGTWLHGSTSVELVDAPAGLLGLSGSLVWLMGQEDAGRIRPTLYGVIREGGS